MRSLVTLLFFSLAGVAGWYGYKHLEELESFLPWGQPRVIEHVLTDRTGRTVFVQILARNQTEVHFVRLEDKREFHYPIDLLSDQDQAFLRGIPVTELQPVRDPLHPSVVAGQEMQKTREEYLRRKRDDLEHKIGLLELETKKQSDKSPELSPEQIDQRIKEYRNQMIDIDQELREIVFQERHSNN